MRLWEQTIVLPESWTCLTIRERVNFASSHKVERFPKLFHSPDKRLVRVHLEDGNAPQCRSRSTQKSLISNSAWLNQYQKIKILLVNFFIKMEFTSREQNPRVLEHTNNSKYRYRMTRKAYYLVVPCRCDSSVLHDHRKKACRTI